jgi:tRNA pseudouridine55 synthase
VRRIGHAGTLDPLATGVLVVAVGRATRLVEYVTDVDKAYLAEVTFGIETDTYDAEGTVTFKRDASHLSREAIEGALGQFRGTIEQRPPAHSAISVGGKRLYQLARAGEVVEAPLRKVEVRSLELREWRPPVATVFLDCSKGTYVRSLAHDLGAALGTGAHLSALRRTRVGEYLVEDAVPLDQLEAQLKTGEWERSAIPLERAVSHLPAIELDASAQTELERGRQVALQPDSLHAAGTLCRALSPDGRLVAMVRVIEIEGGRRIRPDKVLSIAG